MARLSDSSMKHLDLKDSVTCIKGVGPGALSLLKKNGIETIEDALFAIPREYEDRSCLVPLKDLRSNVSSTMKGCVTSARRVQSGGRSRFQVTISDGTGIVSLVWFHGAQHFEKEFRVGTWYVFYGEVKFYLGKPTVSHPDFEKAQFDATGNIEPSLHFGRVVPIYPLTEGLSQKKIRRIMFEVVSSALPFLNDPLPKAMRTRLNLEELKESLSTLHFPQSSQDSTIGSSLVRDSSRVPNFKKNAAMRRVIFEEFFALQLGLCLKKKERQGLKSHALVDKIGLLKAFIASLPYNLTEAQLKVLGVVETDLAKNQSKTRLIQGDVGSGKTVIAFGSAVIACAAGYQTALMVPTEVLAEQHYSVAKKILEPLGISVALISQGAKERDLAQEKIKYGEASIAIGTQALFQKDVDFFKLGLVIVDEQHRFGVEQRSLLLKKASNHSPHLLMLTATPIPRTLALTLYGDLDISLIREKPVGRKPIITRVIYPHDRPKLYAQIGDTVSKGEQVYIIYPLIDDSTKLDLKSAKQMHACLSKEIFPQYSVGLLHGRMDSYEKDKVLSDFKAGLIQILISTTVIEVGVDVANASLMVIEHPERLGLSQLHQLRGRVGRGSNESCCILLAHDKTSHRLKIMEETDDGFKIAEEDLKIRGPGEFLGTRQSGMPGFRVGNILHDSELLDLARIEAENLVGTDPLLQKEEHQGIKFWVESRLKEKMERLRMGN